MAGYSPDSRAFRVAAYGRVSTNHEDQLNALENQIQWYKEYVASRPLWTFIDLYVDEGVTGTSAKKRVGFNQMIEDAKNHRFDLIITREASRWARNIVDALTYTRLLKAHGVSTYFIEDNIFIDPINMNDDELRLSLMSMLSQDESRKTSIRVKAGQAISMKNGVIYGTGNILGYKKNGKEFLIDPEQAETVRMIYDMYLGNIGMRGIKDELEKQGRLTAMGHRKWNTRTISYILKNSFYCGRIVYHKQFVPDFLNQDKRMKNTGQIEQIIVEGNHERIITPEEFESVQTIISRNKRNDNIGRKKPKNLWQKLMFCGECGNSFYRVAWHSNREKKDYAYQCVGRETSGSIETRKKKGLSIEGICDVPCIPEWKLELMADYLFRYLLHNEENYDSEVEKLSKIAATMLKNSKMIYDEDHHKKQIIQMIDAEKAAVKKLEARISGFADMAADHEITVETFRKKKKEINTEIIIRKETITGLEKELSSVIDSTGTTDIQKAGTDYDEIPYEKLYLEIRDVLKSTPVFDNEGNINLNLVEIFVEKIEVRKDGLIWYMKFDADNPAGRKLDVAGRKGKTATVVYSATGRDRQSAQLVIFEGLITREIAVDFAKRYPQKISKITV